MRALADGPVAAACVMPFDLPETTSKIDGPLVRQFSVFLPNKVGAMLDIMKLLNAPHAGGQNGVASKHLTFADRDPATNFCRWFGAARKC